MQFSSLNVICIRMERTKTKFANAGMTEEEKKTCCWNAHAPNDLSVLNSKNKQTYDWSWRYRYSILFLSIHSLVFTLDRWSVVHLTVHTWSCWTLSHSQHMCECVRMLNGDIITRMDIWLCWFHFEQFYFYFLFFFLYIYLHRQQVGKKTCLYQEEWLQEKKRLETCYALASQINTKLDSGVRPKERYESRNQHFYCSFCVSLWPRNFHLFKCSHFQFERQVWRQLKVKQEFKNKRNRFHDNGQSRIGETRENSLKNKE